MYLMVQTSFLFSQNLQLHYDFGKDRKYLTSTVEMLKFDNYGSTFFFVDVDYNAQGNKSASLSYFEIARYISLPFICDKLSATVQYNDGLAVATPFGHVWLAGLSYPINLGFMDLYTDVLFRKQYGNDPAFQLTFVWNKKVLNDKLQFTGFFDLWSADKHNELGAKDGTQLVFLTEPQIWYNVWDRLSIGGEVEISNNFIFGKSGVQVCPTLGVKWSFD